MHVRRRFNLVRQALNDFRAQEGLPPVESILGKVSKREYVDIVQPVLKQTGESLKGALLAIYTVSSDVLRTYYMLKNAGLVQVKSKGLFHLHDDFKVSFTDPSGKVKSTLLFDFPS